MKRMVIFICVLFLMLDIADDGCLGKAKFNLPQPQAETSLTSSYHPDSNQTDFHHKLTATDLPGIHRLEYTQPVTLCVLPTIRIIHCCHLSSSGGIPL